MLSNSVCVSLEYLVTGLGFGIMVFCACVRACESAVRYSWECDADQLNRSLLRQPRFRDAKQSDDLISRVAALAVTLWTT